MCLSADVEGTMMIEWRSGLSFRDTELRLIVDINQGWSRSFACAV